MCDRCVTPDHCPACQSPLSPYLYAVTPSGVRCVPCAQVELLASLKAKPFELEPLRMWGIPDAKLVRMLEASCRH